MTYENLGIIVTQADEQMTHEIEVTVIPTPDDEEGDDDEKGNDNGKEKEHREVKDNS